MRIIKKGATDQSVVIRIVDSGDGTPEEGVEHDSSGIALWYRRAGAAKVAITPAALSALTDAHSDGGIEHIDDGYYRLDVADAAFATGADNVSIGGTVTGMVVIGVEVQLVAVDLQDAVRFGLTALPNAAADAAGGLPISDAGGLDLDAKLAATNEVTTARMGALTDLIDGGRLDLLIDAIKAKSDNLPASPAAVGSAMTLSDGAITTAKFADGAITAAKFAAGAFDAVWTVATRILTAATNITSTGGTTVPQTGDSYARLGAPVGASLSADLQVVDGVADAIKAKTDNLPAAPAATGDIPTANQNADALLDRADAIETGWTLRMVLRILAAAAGGKLSGAATTTNTIRDITDTKDRIAATVDADGNRSAITLDGT